MTAERPGLKSGAVVVIPAAHYLGGSGPMLLRVAEVGGDPRADWALVAGVELDEEGQEAERVSILVRTAAIPAIAAGRARDDWPLPPIPVSGLRLRQCGDDVA